MKKKKNSLVKVISLVLLLGLIFSGLLGYDLYKKILMNNIEFGDGIEERYIFIESSSDLSDVIALLESYDLLLDVNSFKWVSSA